MGTFLTAILCTARKEPGFQWMADSLTIALDVYKGPFELIVVDKLIWDTANDCEVCQCPRARRQELSNAINGRFSYRHVPPKPSPWQGPWRKTKRDFYDLNNARNTGIALARGDRIILFDDCSILDKDFLIGHAYGSRHRVAIAGSFRSYTRAHIETGTIIDGELHPVGIDGRGEKPMLCSGGWLYGLNCSFPLTAVLDVNGYDEKFSGQGGSEDCFGFETEIITAAGVRKIGELVGQEVTLITSNRKWVKALIKCASKQRLWRIFCKNGHRHEKEIFATPNHRWFVKGPNKENRNTHLVTTEELQVGHRLAYLTANNALKTTTVPSPFGIAHGFTFGDGGNDAERPKATGRTGLYGYKKELLSYFVNCPQSSTKCDGIVVSGLPAFFKQPPPMDETTGYLLGWVMGYFAADGSISMSGMASLSSASFEAINKFRDVCLVLGIECYPIRSYVHDTSFKDNSTIYVVTLARHSLTRDFFLRSDQRSRFKENKNTEYTTNRLNEWEVINVEPTNRVEETYCAEVPETESFVLDGHILTHNCHFGIRLALAGYKIVYLPNCLIYQILENHEPVCEIETWGNPQKTPQKELMLADGRMHFANEFLIETWAKNPRVEPYDNDFNLKELRKEALKTGNFPTERKLETDWRDGQRLSEMG